jgi:hypothetical protein
MEEALANLATAPATNWPSLASLALIPMMTPQETHPANLLTTPATLLATLTLPATFGITPAPMEEALPSLATAPVMNPASLSSLVPIPLQSLYSVIPF